MAKSMAAPWIRSAVLELGRGPTLGAPSAAAGVRKGKVVQVLRCNDAVRCIEVSDRDSRIAVMLTDECYRRLLLTDDEFSLSNLRNCVVKLDTWHLSTVVQAAGNRDISKFGELNISFPFVLQCSKLILLGGADYTRIGEPVDINRHPSTRRLLSQTDYVSLVERLRAAQFPTEAALPDPDGAFSVPQPYGDSCPLIWEHAVIPPEQQRQLMEMTATLTKHVRVGERERGSSEDEHSLLSGTWDPAGDTGAGDTQEATQADPTAERPMMVLWRHGQALSNHLAEREPLSQTQIDSQAIPDAVQDLHLRHTGLEIESAYQTQTDEFVPSQGQSWFTQPLGDQFIHDVELRLNPFNKNSVQVSPAKIVTHGIEPDNSQAKSIDLNDEEELYESNELVGVAVIKHFKGFGLFKGKVVSRRRIYTRRGRAAQRNGGETESSTDFLFRVVYEDGDAEELSEKDIRKIIARDGSRPSLQSSDRAIYENVTSIDQDDETRKNSGKRLSQLKGSHGVKKMRVVIETPSATDNLQPMEIPASMTVDEELAEGTGKERSSNFSQAISFLFKAPMPTISALDQVGPLVKQAERNLLRSGT